MGEYESGLSFLSNTLAVGGPTISYRIRFSHHFQAGYKITDPKAYMHHNEIIALMFSPSVFHHASHDKIGWVRKHGLLIYFLRDSDDKQLVFIQTKHRPDRRLLESVWRTDFTRHANRHFFYSPFANRTNEINVTLNFTNLSAAVEFNGVHLTHFDLPADLFPEHKCAVTLLTQTFMDTPVKVGVEEVSIFREVEPLESHDQHFHHSMRRLKEVTHANDPHYRKNMSLANGFVISVG